MYTLSEVEFYITNVCTLNCPNCNRYNNYAFAGHQRWDNYKEDYKKWARVVSIEREIRIIGGEPMSNPDFLKWVNGIAKLWPSTSIRIISNGEQLKNWPTLYDVLFSFRGRITLELCDHNRDESQKTFDRINDFLIGSITKTDEPSVMIPEYDHRESVIKFVSLPSEEKDRIKFTDINGITVSYFPAWQFTQAPANYNPLTGKFDFYNSNPKLAARHCPQVYCHQFYNGMLYKCPQVTVWPEFIEQFPTSLSEEDKNLIKSYEPAKHDWDKQRLDKFFRSLRVYDPIHQCKFCPESYSYKEIKTSYKKIPIKKI